MSKNNKIIPVLILQVLQLPDPWPEDQPQYYFRSGTVTRHPPERFIFMNKIFNQRKWAKIVKSYLYSGKYFRWPTQARQVDPSIISDPAHSSTCNIHFHEQMFKSPEI